MSDLKEEITKMLIKDWDYQPFQAPDVAEKLLNMDSEIQKSFRQWIQVGVFPDEPEYSGFTPGKLSQLVTIKPPAIFLLLDWIRREPSEALAAMKDELIKSTAGDNHV